MLHKNPDRKYYVIHTEREREMGRREREKVSKGIHRGMFF